MGNRYQLLDELIKELIYRRWWHSPTSQVSYGIKAQGRGALLTAAGVQNKESTVNGRCLGAS